MSKTITDIIPPSRRKAEGYAAAPESEEPPTRYSRPPQPLRDGPPVRARQFPYGTGVLALLLITGSVILLASFANAKVTITPKVTTATINEQFTATAGVGDFQYAVVTVTKTVSAAVPAESTETVNDPAQGTITISNAQNTPQTLIKNTRFESADGHIFRIHDGVVVPAGAPNKPGTVTAIAYADIGGEGYNIDATTFTLPGLKGSKVYTLVTATSDAPMKGGFAGTRASVSKTTRDTQNEKSKTVLQKELLDEAALKLAEGYVLIPGSTYTSYLPQNDTVAKSGQVNVNLQGTLTAVAFPNQAIAKAIASKIVGTYGDQPVHLLSPEKLTLSPEQPDTIPDGNGPYTFTLKGDTAIAWDIDAKKITAAIAGKSREAANNILKSFPEVDYAVLQVRPFWKQSFPQDPADITVVVENATKGS